MPDKMHLVMVLHSHQPVGNFDHVFAKATSECYRPVMEILHQYPDFRLGLHFSGPLLSWLQQGEPELLELIKEMSDRGQVELLSGAFYEPLLAAIPRKDALAQLKMQNKFLQKNFDAGPKGFWLAERIWEPGLPEIVAQANLKYTIVDDTHFYYAGLNAQDMFGYHLTERAGNVLALFPTHKQLRYTIPFKDPQQTTQFLRQAFEAYGPTCATYGDDTEKFGLWPLTHKLVIEQGWLKDFIESVLKEDSWLRASTPSSFMKTHLPQGRIYLPTSSYEEMLIWALPWDVALQLEKLIKELKEEDKYEQMRRFLRGGLWENFLVKYRESNLMHKKMLHISERLRDRKLNEAYDNLLQAQCNCSYWHGLFGGLYLSHIRHAVHRNLITAESLLDRHDNPKDSFVKSGRLDFDLDGNDEVMLASHDLDCIIHPSYGGSISLLNLRRHKFHLADTLTRRPEAYHHLFTEESEICAVCDNEKGASLENSESEEIFSPHDKIVVKEEGLENHLIYDWYQRAVFQDHVLPEYVTLEQFRMPNYTEWGDFIDQPYTIMRQPVRMQYASCRMRRAGHIWAPGGPWPLEVQKFFKLHPGGRLSCNYSLQSLNPHTPPFLWAVELNLSLLSEQDPDKYLQLGAQALALSETVTSKEPVREMALVNNIDGFTVKFRLNQPADIWCWPVETVSQSEAGLEKNYQGSSLVIVWKNQGGQNQQDFKIEMDLV